MWKTGYSGRCWIKAWLPAEWCPSLSPRHCRRFHPVSSHPDYIPWLTDYLTESQTSPLRPMTLTCKQSFAVYDQLYVYEFSGATCVLSPFMETDSYSRLFRTDKNTDEVTPSSSQKKHNLCQVYYDTYSYSQISLLRTITSINKMINSFVLLKFRLFAN